MPNISDSLSKRIEEVLDDIDVVEDFYVSDTDDPDVIDITIRGRLKKDIGRKYKKQQDPQSDYDRAMKGISPYAEQIKSERE